MAYINFSREKGFEYEFSEGEFGGLLIVIVVLMFFIGFMVKG